MESPLSFEAPEELLRQRGWMQALARSILRAPEEAEDATQDALLAAWQHPPEDGRPVRPWLGTVVANFARRLRRGKARRRSRELAVSSGDSQPDPVELFAVQQDVGRAVQRLEEPLRSTIVLHYFGGLDASEIARRHGVPPATVRQRLHRARERLRADLERHYGSAPALGAALAKLADEDAGGSMTGATQATAGSPLGIPLKLLALAGAAALAFGLGWTLWSETRRSDAGTTQLTRAASAELGAIGARAPASRAAESAGTSAREPSRGASGHSQVETTREHGGVQRLAGGFQVAGEVVDGEGRALPGAEVLVSEAFPAWESLAVVARTDAAGRFRLESVHDRQDIVARAAGFAPSIGVWIHARPGAEVPLRIVLDRRGQLVHGRVRDERNQPVSAALVCIGVDGRPKMFLDSDDGRRAPPAVTRTDAAGEFRLEHVPAGRQPVFVQASGCAPWRGEVVVDEGTLAEIDVRVGPGASVRGQVRDPGGAALAGVAVSRPRGETSLFRPRTLTDERGEFRLEGLEPGLARLVASDDAHGRAETELELVVGQESEWNPVLDPLARISGKLRGTAGEPLAGWEVRLKRGEQQETRPTDEHGAFAFAVELGSTWRLAAFAPGVVEGYPSLVVRDARPAGEPLALALPDLAATTARVVGRVVSADLAGTGAAVATAWQWPEELWGAFPLGSTGRFEIAPVPPGNIGVQVQSQRFGRVHLGEHAVEAGQELDLGTLVLAETGRVHGTLRGPAAERPVSIDIRRLDVDVDSDAASVAGASFRSPELQPGEYELYAHGDRVASIRRTLTIESGVDLALDLELLPAALRPLVLKLPEPGATPWLWCHVRDASGESRWFGAGDAADGALELRVSAVPGTYRVEAFSEDGGELTGLMEITAEDDQAPLVLEFPPH